MLMGEGWAVPVVTVVGYVVGAFVGLVVRMGMGAGSVVRGVGWEAMEVIIKGEA